MRHHQNISIAALGIVGLFCGVLALAACGGNSSATTPPSAASITTHVQSANLRDATFTETAKTTTAAGTLTTSSHGVLTMHPFAEQITSTSTVNGQQQQSATIYDGQNLYTKSSTDAKWTKEPAGTQTNQAAATSSVASVTTLPNAQLVGSATVNGTAVWHLRGSGTQVSNGQTVTYTRDLWVRKDNYQPVKSVEQTTTQQGTVDDSINFTAWNTGVTITPPPTNQIANA